MKFPPKECPACGCPYWQKQEDSTGDATAIWKGSDGEWYHGPTKATSMLVCPNCRFGFSLTLEKGKLPEHTFLENLVKSYQKFIHPGVANRLLLQLPPTVHLTEVKPNRKEGYLEITYRISLEEWTEAQPQPPEEPSSETPEAT